MWKRTPRNRGDVARHETGDVSAGSRPSATRGALWPRVLLFALWALALGTLPAFSSGEQELSPTAGRRVSAPRSMQAAPAITQVDIRGTGREAIVRVEGDGQLTAHPFRLPGPERLVLDFPGARLALARPSIPGARGPVRRVRVGQFKPEVARVVIDLALAAPYLLQSEGQSVTVSFALAREAPAAEPAISSRKAGPAWPVVPAHRTETSPPAPLSPAAEEAGGMLRPVLGRELGGALASPVPPGTAVEPPENLITSHRIRKREAALAQLRQEAEELARLAESIPAQVEQVTQGKLPKDFPENLKRIDKLVKRLRAEVMP